MTWNKFLGFFLFLSSLLFGCSGCSSSSTGGTETGNATAVSLRVVGYQSSKLAALTVGSLTIDTARVVLDRLRFRPFSICNSGGEDSGAGEIQFDGPFVVDLLNPPTLAGLENLRIATGLYCRIELTFKKLEPEKLPSGMSPSDPIVNRSILIEGRRSDGTSFQITTDIDNEFELENEATGFRIEASSSLALFFIAFDLDRWFRSINLSDPSIEVSTDAAGNPIILINDVKNQSVQKAIEDNIKDSADLFNDRNDNESLDPEEQQNSLAAGATIP